MNDQHLPPEYDDLPLYALGWVDSATRERIEAALANDPRLAEELARYQALGAALHTALPTQVPPPDLRARILHAAQPAPASVVAMPFSRPLVSRTWLIACVAVLAVFIITNLYWFAQIDALSRQVAALTRSAGMDVVLNVAGTRGHRTRDIAFQQPIAATGQLQWARAAESGTWFCIMQVQTLPVLAGETYQLWLIHPDEGPLSVAIFDAEEDGTAFILFEMSQPLSTFAFIGVTIEPAGGSEQPTTEPVLLVELRT